MREIEKYCFEYIFLGLPQSPFRFFLKFFLKKGIRPTVYSDTISFPAGMLCTAKVNRLYTTDRDEIVTEVLKRHAAAHRFKRITLVYSPSFIDFINRNRSYLEGFFVIRRPEDIYEA